MALSKSQRIASISTDIYYLVKYQTANRSITNPIMNSTFSRLVVFLILRFTFIVFPVII
nr:MAG TPA_asm: hypothetical protein [Caudoviricetes sp.]